MEEKIPMIV